MTDDRDPLLDVARDLHAICDMHLALPQQAAHKATARLIPGGLAMVCLGPVASPEAVGYVVDTAETRRTEWLDEIPDNDDDWEPPLQTLRFWSESWRVEWGREVDGWTVQTEAGFLLGVLRWAFEHEPHWADFERDVRQARRRLEDVLYAGEREERSRVPCVYCDTDSDGQPIKIRLIHKYGGKVKDDYWVCPKCRRDYNRDAFSKAQEAHLGSEPADRFVALYDAVAAIPRPNTTVRSWLYHTEVRIEPFTGARKVVERGSARWACDLKTRRVVVWWPHIRDLHAEKLEREARRAC